MHPCELESECIERLKSLLKRLKAEELNTEKTFHLIKTKIGEMKKLLNTTEQACKQHMADEDSKEIPTTKAKYITIKGRITQVKADNPVKHAFAPVSKCDIICGHEFKDLPAFTYTKTNYITRKEQLEALNPDSYYIVDVFDHNSNSYRGYVCFLSLLDVQGTLHIVDALRLRNELIELGFFQCNYKKIFVSELAYLKALNDFRNISCYIICNFECQWIKKYRSFAQNIKVDIDWRIRPIDRYLSFMLQIGLVSKIASINQFSKALLGKEENIKQKKNKSKDVVIPKSEDFATLSFVKKLKKASYMKELLEAYSLYHPFSPSKPVKCLLTDLFSGKEVVRTKKTFQLQKCMDFKPKNDDDMLYIECKNADLKAAMLDFICIKYNIEHSSYLKQLIDHRDTIAMTHNKSLYQVMDNKTLVKIAKLQPDSYESFKDIQDSLSSLAKDNYHGWLKSEDIKDHNDTPNLTTHPYQFDMRGNQLEEKRSVWKKKGKIKDKFIYTEDSSDYVLEEETKKTNKKEMKKKAIQDEEKAENKITKQIKQEKEASKKKGTAKQVKKEKGK